jgi:hypothetical protein
MKILRASFHRGSLSYIRNFLQTANTDFSEIEIGDAQA